MSIEHNSQRSIDGLNTLSCDVINVVESIEIDGDNGANKQLLTSNGTNTYWGSIENLFEPLTVDTPLSFTAGADYDGSVAREITISNIPNSKLQNSTISGVSLGSNLNAITPSAPLSFSEGGTYTGAGAKTLQITNIPNSDLQNSTISGVSLGSNLANLDTAGYGIGMGASYNGGTARSIALSFGAGITADGGGIKLINANTDLTLGNTTIALGATAADLDMGTGTIEDAVLEDCNILDATNKVLPPNVYNNGGQYVMPFDAGIFLPNDDSTYYNYCLEDDGSKTTGRGNIKSISLEILGVVHIPRGWTATGTFVDIRDSSGNVITSSPPTYVVWKIELFKSGGTIDNRVDMTGMYASAINTENAFVGGNTFTGVYNYALVIDISMTATTHFLGGGYILLNAPS